MGTAGAYKFAENTINAGTYILEPKVLDLIPAGENHSFDYGHNPDTSRMAMVVTPARSTSFLLL
jgi:NDP-sugar pyrophosphorylase family protein